MATATLLVSAPPSLSSIPAAFPFNTTPVASARAPLHFDRPTPKISVVAGKRCRGVADVDGDGASPRPKKRRLRLHLITSRLSQPFAAPSTYINSRGAFIAARLAFQRRVGRSLLRKAAIENWMRIRRGVHVSGRRPVDGFDIPSGIGSWAGEARWPDEAVQWGIASLNDPNRMDQELSAPGLSNYHAIDLEESPFDEGSWSDAHEEMDLDIYGSRPPDEILTDALGAMYQGSRRAWAAGDPMQMNPYWVVLAEEDRQRELTLAAFSKRPQL